MELTEKKCVPCRGGVPPLDPLAARELARQTPRWKVSAAADRLSRQFVFKDFVRAMEFVAKVAVLAEREGHHPDFAVHYNKVDLVLWTHAIGGLHENDFIMAAKIDALDIPRPEGGA